MAFFAMAIGALSALGGLRLAVHFDTQVGPSIICVAVLIFAVSRVGKYLPRLPV